MQFKNDQIDTSKEETLTMAKQIQKNTHEYHWPSGKYKSKLQRDAMSPVRMT